MLKYLSVVILLFVTPCYATDFSADGNTQLYLQMESVGNEIAAVGTDLTENGTIPRDADAKQGSWSRDWEDDGEDDFLNHADGNETDISGANQSISVGCWYKRESETGNSHYLIVKWDSASEKQYLLSMINNAGADDPAAFTLSSTSDDNTSAIGGTTTPSGSWTHIVGVYNDTDIRIYVNGSLDTNGANNPKAYVAGIADAASDFRIGTQSDNLDNWADGLIDEVFVMDRALSAAEVSEIFTNGFEGSGVTGGGGSQILFTELE